MKYYFIAETPYGKFLGQYPSIEIPKLLERGAIKASHQLCEASGSYAEVQESKGTQWMSVGDFLSSHPTPEIEESEETKAPDSEIARGIAELRHELIQIRTECAKTKWAARAIAILVALVVLFGFKIVIK